MTAIMVGAPVCQRGWALPSYFNHLEKAVSYAGVSVDYVFVVPTWDAESRELIRGYKPTAEILDSKEPQRQDVRQWHLSRYEHLAALRNQLLSVVRETSPDWYWSVDSDIFVREDALAVVLEDNAARDEPFAGVGMRTYMCAWPERVPSYGMMRGEGLSGRIDQDGFFPVDVIMACKLLGPQAYEVDYQPHSQGEDVGWSAACRQAGLRLGWHGGAWAKHVMSPLLLNQVDPRVGF